MIKLTTMTPGTFLRQPTDGAIKHDADLWGFRSLHGGLALGVLIAAMQEHAPDVRLRSATARYDRPITGEVQIETSVSRAGRSVTSLAASAVSDAGIHVHATAVFAESRPGSWPSFAPQAPVVPPPQDNDMFVAPPSFVPILQHLEVRTVGPNLPYTGGADPELTAWVRLIEDDDPPDASRLAFLVDALAPSYAAVLTQLAPVPTIELSLRPSGNLAMASSPWVLLRARSRTVGSDGWIDEEIDAWGPDGAHLGSAQQLRLVRAA
jgi:Thioesterase-like superfamily